MIDCFEQWALELSSIAREVEQIGAYLESDSAFGMERALLLGAMICRVLFDRAKEDQTSINQGNMHYDPVLVDELNRIGEIVVTVEGSIGEGWSLGESFDMNYRKLCNQIIHATALQFWKSPNPNDLSFFLHSKKEARQQRFYHVTWNQYHQMLISVIHAQRN